MILKFRTEKLAKSS